MNTLLVRLYVTNWARPVGRMGHKPAAGTLSGTWIECRVPSTLKQDQPREKAALSFPPTKTTNARQQVFSQLRRRKQVRGSTYLSTAQVCTLFLISFRLALFTSPSNRPAKGLATLPHYDVKASKVNGWPTWISQSKNNVDHFNLI